MKLTYSYRSLFSQKSHDFRLEDNNLFINNQKYEFRGVTKINFHISLRPKSSVFINKNRFNILSASFNEQRKPITKTDEYNTFLLTLINQCNETTIFLQGSWTHYYLQMTSSIILTSTSLIFAYISFQTFLTESVENDFYLLIGCSFLFLIMGVISFFTLKKPKILSKEQALNSCAN